MPGTSMCRCCTAPGACTRQKKRSYKSTEIILPLHRKADTIVSWCFTPYHLLTRGCFLPDAWGVVCLENGQGTCTVAAAEVRSTHGTLLITETFLALLVCYGRIFFYLSVSRFLRQTCKTAAACCPPQGECYDSVFFFLFPLLLMYALHFWFVSAPTAVPVSYVPTG